MLGLMDAIDPDLLRPIAAPTTGTEFLISQRSNLSYKRLSRVIGDEDFFELLQRWAPSEAVTSLRTNFIALAEEVSGMELDELFDTWLFAPEKPVID